MSARPELGDWGSPAELEHLQDTHLEAALEAAARSPFYRARHGGAPPRDREALRRTALTTKQDLRDAYPFGLLAVPRSRLATYHESSGTSGEATASYYTDEDWLDLTERYARKHVGIGPDDTFLVRTPYALMITGHLAHAAARSRGATVVPADNRSLATPFARVVRLLRDLDVTLTWSLPADTLLWAAAARAAGYQPDRDFPALRALFVAGEPLSRARRARIGELWAADVVEEYGATETGSLAGECPLGRLHLWADRAIFEVHDPRTGVTGAHGRGQLVVTPLFRQAMPLLRYNIEDEVEVSHEPCPCGWHLPTVRVLGRSALTGGTRLTQLDVEELVFSLPAEFGVMFWRARAGGDRIEIEIEVAERHRRPAAAELAASVRRVLGMDAAVVTTPPGGLVPLPLLTAPADVMKPRGLFAAGEDWDKALLYH
ncbi:phenylacetate--CoA ligase family protein [Dactylosporangium cerinum]|uniref:Phenylacetate--CoA ligase family protein n=1 Tax=Dactylosporangium cerinum TaxID=1434730 RepID=A0ABV9WJJ9_9ACTN